VKNRPGVFDEIDLDDEYNTGPSIYYPNQNIRRMLTLARAGENDVFCDLGSGYAQNIIIALTEFGVKRAFGFELNRERLYKSKRRLSDAHFSNIAQIIGRSFDFGLTESHLRSATIIYYGLHSDSVSTIEMIDQIEQTWGKLPPGRRFVYHHNNVIPELMPNDSDFPFYVSTTQPSSSGKSLFSRPKSEKDWLNAVVSVPKEMMHRRAPTLKQLWTEFRNNFDVEGNVSAVEAEDGVRERLRNAVSENK
jgi:hypothetical protein